MFKQSSAKPTGVNRNLRSRAARDNMLDFQMLEQRQLLASFTVSSLNDSGPGSLRLAIAAANGNGQTDTIDFSVAGTINLDSQLPTISESLTIDGDNAVTIDAGNGPDGYFATGDGFRIFHIDDGTSSDIDVTLQGLTLTGGDAPSGTGSNSGESGGAILSTENLTLIDSTVSDNSAGQGASSQFGGSTTNGGSGGGIYSDGPLTLVNTNVSGNRSGKGGAGFGSEDGGNGGSGGGIYSNGVLTLINATISGNQADVGGSSFSSGDGGNGGSGGGIFSNGTLTLVNTTISGNRSGIGTSGGGSGDGGNGGSGGGIYSNGTLTLVSTTISGNRAERGGSGRGSGVGGNGGSGGGIFTDDILTVTNSTISGNSAGRGGSGDFFTYSTPGDGGDGGSGGGVYAAEKFVLLSSTITDNTAGSRGSGGYQYLGPGNYIYGGAGSLGKGSGVFSDNSLTITHSIIAQNSTSSLVGDLRTNPAETPDVQHSLIGNNVDSGLAEAKTADGKGNLIGSESDPIDPIIGELLHNGGPTKTHALLPGSPAIDAGSNSLAEDVDGQQLEVDQRGTDRVVGGSSSNTVDIGAYEYNPDMPFGDAPRITSVIRDRGGVLARPDLIDTYEVTFNEDVNITAGDLIILEYSIFSSSLIDSSDVRFSYHAATKTATWDFENVTLFPKFYSFQISDNVTSKNSNLGLDSDNDGNPDGENEADVYIALPGDANLDGTVDVSKIVFVNGVPSNVGDASILLANLGQTTGQRWGDGDFNADGDIDVSELVFVPTIANVGDASILLANLGRSVSVPSGVVAATSAMTVPVTAAATASTPIPFVVRSDATEASAEVVLLPRTDQTDGDKLQQHFKDRRLTVVDPTNHSVLAGNQELDDTFADTDWNSNGIAISFVDSIQSANEDPLEVVFSELND